MMSINFCFGKDNQKKFLVKRGNNLKNQKDLSSKRKI
jgi:hypothetical protein